NLRGGSADCPPRAAATGRTAGIRIDRAGRMSMFGKPNLGNQTPPRFGSRIPGGNPMARPASKDLTERELEVMHLFWRHGEQTAVEARDRLAAVGPDLTYPTVANLVRALHEKGFLEPTNDERPFRYRPRRSYEDVSGRLLGEV